MIHVVIPGPPFAQPRDRTRVVSRKRDGKPIAVHYDPREARDWKATARQHMLDVMGATPPISGPVEMIVFALFECPRSCWRKTKLVPRQPYLGNKDWDNLGKPVSDAGNGVLFLDDRQVWNGQVIAVVGAQGEAPFVETVVVPTRVFTGYPAHLWSLLSTRARGVEKGVRDEGADGGDRVPAGSELRRAQGTLL